MRHLFILHEKFRQGSTYQLVEWNKLPQKHRELLSGMYEEAEIYGFFQPVNATPGFTVKVAYREVAMLWFHLQYAEFLPHYFIAAGTQNNNDTIARMVLDNIIEIEWNNQFVSGSAALVALYGETIYEEKVNPGHLTQLSMDAIRYAWMLDEPDLKSLTNRLYSFNTLPWDHFKRNSFLSKHSVREFLFNNTIESFQQELNTHWHYFRSSEKKGWFSWVRSGKISNSVTTNPKIYKLYISPVIEDLPAVFVKSIPVITASNAISFKTGSTIQGLLRPDKMVVYFLDSASLFETAGLLEKACTGVRPQGVPFSAQIDKAGILSHGVDPFPVDYPETIETGSWRTIVTNELALAIIQSKTGQLDWKQSIPFIRARLLSAGIDTHNWSCIN